MSAPQPLQSIAYLSQSHWAIGGYINNVGSFDEWPLDAWADGPSPLHPSAVKSASFRIVILDVNGTMRPALVRISSSMAPSPCQRI